MQTSIPETLGFEKESAETKALYGMDQNHTDLAAQVDKPIAGLLKDLKRRGMLDDTLVVLGTEFSRSPGAQDNGRDHHPEGFCAWLAGDGKRWVRIANPGNGAALLLAKAVGDTQIAAIGNQTGGRVGFFLTVANFDEMFAHMERNGVLFDGEPRMEPYGQVIVFQDLYGNRWDLLGPQRCEH